MPAGQIRACPRWGHAANRPHFRIAKGSLPEVYAVLDLLDQASEHLAVIERLDRLLYGLQR